MIAPAPSSSAPAAAADVRVSTRFFPVSEPLRPYCSIIYLTEIEAPPGERVVDYLHPEWANVRFIEGEPPLAAIGGGAEEASAVPSIVVAGATSRASYFAAGTISVWGIGILPMGWVKFFQLPAADLADSFCDGAAHPAFGGFGPLAETLRRINDVEAAAAAIDAFFNDMLHGAPRDDPAIFAAHHALVEDDPDTVADLARQLGMSERSIERLCHRAFGFPPKLLLRRQRFLRSLARFMLDPSMAWIDTLDHQYYDQAQFTRDFQRFMGMTPRTYAALPKPILGVAAFARAAAAGEAMLGLHKPRE